MPGTLDFERMEANEVSMFLFQQAKTSADELFNNNTCDSYLCDDAILVTMRALLYPRIENDDRVYERLSKSELSADELAGVTGRDLIRMSIGTDPVRNTLYVHNVNAESPDDRAAFFERADDPENGFASLNGFREITSIRNFFRNGCGKPKNVRCYTNEQERVTFVIVDELTYFKWHILSTMVPRYFGWYFKESPVTEEEQQMLLNILRGR